MLRSFFAREFKLAKKEFLGKRIEELPFSMMECMVL